MTQPLPAPSRAIPRRSRDRGFTLVELLISIVLMGVIGGVVTAAMLTSLNAADSTSATSADSADAGLISAYLVRDAQAAGGTDPTTATPSAALGVSTESGDVGWAGCEQSGAMVVRFAWMDRRVAAEPRPITVTYSLSGDGAFVRRTCDNGAPGVGVVLGRKVASAKVSCLPSISCGGFPDSVTLAVRGSGGSRPFEFSLTASLRAEVQSLPSTSNSATVPLVVLGSRSCPVLNLAGSGRLSVIGDEVINGACGASPIGGDTAKSQVSGLVSMPSALVDPFADLATPSFSCPAGDITRKASKKVELGASPSPTSVTVYGQPVVVAGDVTFRPGLYVFCRGLTIASGANVTGTNVLWYVAEGATTVEPTSTVDVAAMTTGAYANLLLWSASNTPVAIAAGSSVPSYRGTVYAPAAAVNIASAVGVHVGGIVAETVTIDGVGSTRLGLPIPSLRVASSTFPNGRVEQTYSAPPPTVSGGTGPYTWSGSGLPSGLEISSAGAITGVPIAGGRSTITFVATDATGVAVTFTRTLMVAGAPSRCRSTIAGWWGQYWANATLSGSPALCREDASLSFDWGSGSPDPAIPVDRFSARWTRVQDFTAGTYRFTVGSDDGVRVWIDGVMALDRWVDRAEPAFDNFTQVITAGSHEIIMEYYENGGGAVASLSWTN